MLEVVNGLGETVMKYEVEIAEERQRFRDEFTEQLRDTYPDPDDPVRRQCEMMSDQWWPGTLPTPEESNR